jgi:hypothetical protein
MDDAELSTMWAERAKAILDYDDAHPDVGMGMFMDTALDIASQQILKEAARWNSMAALQLDFSGNALTLAKLKLAALRRR